MELIKRFDYDVNEPVKVQYLDGNFFSQDAYGNIFYIYLHDGDTPVTLSGTVSADVIRPDGGTIACSDGGISGNIVFIRFPPAVYAIPGTISIVVKVTDSPIITTVAAVVANVYQSSTDTVVDPGNIIPSIENLIAAIDAAVATIPPDYSALWTHIAPNYSTIVFPVYTGYLCTYNGHLYRAKGDILSSETWTPDHWVQTDIGNNLTEARNLIRSSLDVAGQSILDQYDFDTPTDANVTYTVGSGVITITNGSTNVYAGVFTSATFLAKLIVGRTYRFYARCSVVSGNAAPVLAVWAGNSVISANYCGANGIGAVDFVMASNITRISLCAAWGASTSGCVVSFDDFWVKEMGADAYSRDQISVLKNTVDSLNAFCKKEITDVTEGSINVTSGTDVQKTDHIVTVNIASGTEYKFKLEANSRITKYHFYANETIVQYNCDPETTYTFTASSNISNVSIYCTGTQVVGTGSVKGIVTIVTENSNSLEERIETAESAIDSLEDQVDTIDEDLESLEVFCKKEITDVTKGSIDVTSGVDVQITEHLVNVSIASGTTYRFKIEASGRITKYHLYIDGTVLQYNCVPGTVYTFTAESNITYFSIYCGGDVVVGTGSITGIVTIPTETTNSLEERLETVEEEVEEASSVSDAFIGAKILDMSDIRNSYVEGDIGEEIVFRPTTASKSIVNIIKVKEGLSYDIKVTYGSTISSSSTRGNYIVDDDDTVLQNFGMSATASTTIESQVTAVGDGYLILVVDSGYTGIEITGLIDANDIEAIDKKISGDSAEGILTDLIKARMITCITYFLWTNIHGEELLQNLCDSMGVDGWCDVRPKTGINSTTGLDEPAEVYRQASDFIDVTGTASIQSALSDTLQYPIFYAIRCYDSSKAFLGTAESDAGTTSSLNGNVKRNLVTDTKYIRFLFTPDPINSPTQNLAGVYTGRMLRMELTNSSNVTTTKRFTLREVEEFKDDL